MKIKLILFWFLITGYVVYMAFEIRKETYGWPVFGVFSALVYLSLILLTRRELKRRDKFD